MSNRSRLHVPALLRGLLMLAVLAFVAAPVIAQTQTQTQTQTDAGAPPATGSPESPQGQTIGKVAVKTSDTTVNEKLGFLKRPGFFGEWGGLRTKAREAGTTFGVTFTQFFSWVPEQGVTDQVDYQYGNKLDVTWKSDLGKLAWTGLSMDGHVEMRAGSAPLLSGGTLVPTNTALLLPQPDGIHARLSNLSFTQVLNPHVALSVGRFDTLDLYEHPYTGGAGIDKFMNLTYNAPPLDVRTIPPVTDGIMFGILRGNEVAATVGLIDTSNTGFFANGATVLWDMMLPLKPTTKVGHYTVGGTFSSVQANSLSQSPWVFLPAGGVPPATVTGAWTLRFTFDQALLVDKLAPERNLGVFGMFGVSDANPSPFHPYFFLGVGGHVFLKYRANDTFGVGAYNAGVSNSLVTTASPFFPLGNEQGGEVYYNAALLGWMNVTADLQVVNPAAVDSGTRTFFSLRWKLSF